MKPTENIKIKDKRKGNGINHRSKPWRLKIKKSQPNQKAVKVFHIDSENCLFVFNSISQTAKSLHINRENVRNCLNPKRQRSTAFGFRFEFIPPKIKTTCESTYEEVANAFKTNEQREKDIRNIQYN